MSKKTRNAVIAAAVVVLLALGAFLCWHFLKPGTQQGAKTVAVEVTHADGKTADFTLHTDAEYLWDAMMEQNLVEGKDSQYGKWITAVDGETADEANGHYWMFTKDGAWVDTSCDTTPIADGDHFEFFLYDSNT
jgi:hypothetical protein